MAPPSSGGVALLQMLGVLEKTDLAALGQGSSDHLHLLAETMKHVYADRAHHLGDPDFVEVPVDRLLSPERIDAIARDFWPSRTFPPEHYGPLVAPATDAGTQHISAVDAAGGACALTTTINNPFGSGVVVDELGVVLNDEMDDFSAAPGVPNAFGLVSSTANEIAPGKRPLSSMTPTLVLDADGRVVMVVGGSGGPQIISATLQVLTGILDFGLDAQEAVSAPRVHHQWLPDVLVVEDGVPLDVVRALEARGHVVRQGEHYSSVQVAHRLPDGTWEGGADPRKGGWPASP
jgi:gamma-glutamyltranspeptidase/glutathione hydrolase